MVSGWYNVVSYWLLYQWLHFGRCSGGPPVVTDGFTNKFAICWLRFRQIIVTFESESRLRWFKWHWKRILSFTIPWSPITIFLVPTIESMIFIEQWAFTKWGRTCFMLFLTTHICMLSVMAGCVSCPGVSDMSLLLVRGSPLHIVGKFPCRFRTQVSGYADYCLLDNSLHLWYFYLCSF